MMNARCLIVSSLLVAAAIPASAQVQPEGFSAGIGNAGGVNPYVGDNQVTVVPLVRYDSEQFSIGLPEGVRVTVFESKGFRFSGLLSPRFSAIDSSDAPELDGLERGITLDAGGQVDYRFGRGTSVYLRAVTELTGEHGGSEATLGARQALPLGQTPVFLGAGFSWLSEDLSEYVYGVLDTDTGFAPYAPGDVVIPFVSVGANIPVSDRLSLVTNVRAEVLPDAIIDSPIIEEDISIGALVGLSFRF